MGSSQEYRREASEYMKRACSLDSADEQRELLATAAQWIRLADEADKAPSENSRENPE
jgi:hypothetical protein